MEHTSNMTIILSNGDRVRAASEYDSAPGNESFINNVILPLFAAHDPAIEKRVINDFLRWGDRRLHASYHYIIDLYKTRTLRVYEEKYSKNSRRFVKGHERTEEINRFLTENDIVLK